MKQSTKLILFRYLIAFVMAGLFSLQFAFVVFGSDISTHQSKLYPYQSSIELQEEFISGSTSNAVIGALGFGFSGGTVGIPTSETNRMGLVRRHTSAVSGTIANLTLFFAISGVIDPSNPHSITWIVRLNNNDANTTVRYGAINAIASSPPADGIYIEKLDGDTNWFCVTRNSSVETRTDSGVAVNTAFNTFFYSRNSSGVTFKINNTNVCTHTTNIPTVFINPSTQIINSDASSKSHDHDYFQLTYQGLTR